MSTGLGSKGVLGTFSLRKCGYGRDLLGPKEMLWLRRVSCIDLP
jgi:hypothetical protein